MCSPPLFHFRPRPTYKAHLKRSSTGSAGGSDRPRKRKSISSRKDSETASDEAQMDIDPKENEVLVQSPEVLLLAAVIA